MDTFICSLCIYLCVYVLFLRHVIKTPVFTISVAAVIVMVHLECCCHDNVCRTHRSTRFAASEHGKFVAYISRQAWKFTHELCSVLNEDIVCEPDVGHRWNVASFLQ